MKFAATQKHEQQEPTMSQEMTTRFLSGTILRRSAVQLGLGNGALGAGACMHVSHRASFCTLLIMTLRLVGALASVGALVNLASGGRSGWSARHLVPPFGIRCPGQTHSGSQWKLRLLRPRGRAV